MTTISDIPKNVVHKVIISLLRDIYSVNNIVEYVDTYPILIRSIRRWNQDLLVNIFEKVDKTTFPSILNEMNRLIINDMEKENDDGYWTSKPNGLKTIMCREILIQILLDIDLNVAVDFYSQQYHFGISLPFLLRMLEIHSDEEERIKLIYLYRVDKTEQNYTIEEIYGIIKYFPRLISILSTEDVNGRYDGFNFVLESVKINPETYLYFQDMSLEIDVDTLFLNTPFVLNFVKDLSVLKKLFLPRFRRCRCRSYHRYLSESKFFLIFGDAHNTYVVMSLFPQDVYICILQFLV